MKTKLTALALAMHLSAFGAVLGGPADHMAMGPAIDTSKIPPPIVAPTEPRSRSTNQTTPPSDIGAFRITCRRSHFRFDDPLVFPGIPDRSHLHVFFGNTGITAMSTNESISTTGGSTCHGGVLNRTAYWAPALIDTRTGAPLDPENNLVYYKTGYNHILPSEFAPMPPGLRMIAGSAANAVDVTATNRWAGSPYIWKCINPALGYAVAQGQQIPDCDAGNNLWMIVSFPQCWDGVNVDSPDHKSHMSYLSNGRCPATHPVPLPEITFNINYPMTESGATRYLRLSSDMYDAALPGGRSAHADWWNGWDLMTEATWVNNCIRARVDCHADMLGNGQILY